jgi:hypothetical protein
MGDGRCAHDASQGRNDWKEYMRAGTRILPVFE